MTISVIVTAINMGPVFTTQRTKDSHNTGNFRSYAFRIVFEFFNVFSLNMGGIVRRGLRFIVLIRDLKVLPFADEITKAALSTQLL